MMNIRLDYNLFLTGFMGCGKSTISGKLRELYGMETLEMDETIEEREGMKISKIFEIYGEAYFRDAETRLLTEMRERKNVVVSCGGGTVMRRENVSEMKKNGKIILLTAEPETVYERVKDSHNRPLLENNKTVSYITELMEKRRPKYEAAADLIVHTDDRDAEEICREILDKLQISRR